MDSAINNIRKGLLSMSDAIAKHKSRKQEFIQVREKVLRDIEDARKIWGETYEKMSKSTLKAF